MLAEVNAALIRETQTIDKSCDSLEAGGSSDDGSSGSASSCEQQPPSDGSERPIPMPSSTNESVEFALSKMDRCEYFNQVKLIV
jgi:hypothetical protein